MQNSLARSGSLIWRVAGAARRAGAAIAVATIALGTVAVTSAAAQTAAYKTVTAPAGYVSPNVEYAGPGGRWFAEAWLPDYSSSVSFFWKDGAIVNTFYPGTYGLTSVIFAAFNDADQWVGWGYDSTGFEHPLKWDAVNGLQRLDATSIHPASHMRALSIGNNGMIYGVDNNNDGIQCLYWDATGKHEIATPTGGTCWPGTGSPSGQYFTGDAINADGQDLGFRWDAVNGMIFFDQPSVGILPLDNGRTMGNINNSLMVADADGTTHLIGVQNPDAMFGFWFFNGNRTPNRVGMYAGSYYSMFGGGADSLRGPWLIEADGTNTRLPMGYASSVNNRGQVMGADSNGVQGYWDKVNGFLPFPTVPGYSFGAQMMNDDGQVYGALYDENGAYVQNIIITGLLMPPLLTGGGSGPAPDVTAPVVTVPSNMNVAATTLTGANVTFAVSAMDDRDGAVAASCSKTSGAFFAIGTYTITCSAHDAAGNTGSASFTVTVDNVVPGDIEADGKLTSGASTLDIDFHVFESAKKLNGQLELTITTKPAHFDGDGDDHDKKKGKHKKGDGCEHDRGAGKSVQNTFKGTSIQTAVFSDDPAFNAHSRRTPISDTVIFTGMGKWNGTTGYSYTVSALDASRQRGQDTVSVTIRDAAGTVVAQMAGTLTNGQVESHRVPGQKH